VFDGGRVFAGPDYVLLIRLGPRAQERLDDAWRAIWRRPELDGPYVRRDVEPGDQARLDPRAGARRGFVYGTARTPTGHLVPCSCFATTGSPPTVLAEVTVTLPQTVEPAPEPVHAAAVVFGMPLDVLAPLHGSESMPNVYREPWMRMIDEWLVEIARDVFSTAPFEFAEVGEEVFVAGDELFPREHVEGRDGTLLPDERGNLLWKPHRTSECA
jgi:hypothetical protein